MHWPYPNPPQYKQTFLHSYTTPRRLECDRSPPRNPQFKRPLGVRAGRWVFLRRAEVGSVHHTQHLTLAAASRGLMHNTHDAVACECSPHALGHWVHLQLPVLCVCVCRTVCGSLQESPPACFDPGGRVGKGCGLLAGMVPSQRLAWLGAWGDRIAQ